MVAIPECIVETLVGPPGGAGYLFRDEDQTFKVKGYRGSKPNECTVSISNLSRATIAFLEKPRLVLQLSAGQGVAGVLFRGSIKPRGVVTENGTTRKTTITCVDGQRLWRDTKAAVSWPENTAVALVVQDLLKLATAQGFAIAPSSAYPTDLFPAGYYYLGRWRDALTEILVPRGYAWTVQDRTIYVGLNTSLNAGNVPLVSPTSGLHGSPKRTAKGVNFTCDLDPRIRPGWGVQIKSEFVNGLFRVVTRDHEGDRRGKKWQTSAQCEVIK